MMRPLPPKSSREQLFLLFYRPTSRSFDSSTKPKVEPSMPFRFLNYFTGSKATLPATTTPSAGARPKPPAKDDVKKAKPPGRQESTRETVESIVVAFLLAFLFRAFEAEAFVIPTGSMAPTLYGRHKEMDCQQCGHLITIGASEEVDDGGFLKSRLETGLCPNCRAPNPVKDAPVFRGDRILVNKFPYELKEPRRWDVVVFKYPEEPKTNYIKRLVGVPNETLVIRQGDLYRLESDGEARILRKTDPNKQGELQLLIYDHDFPETPLLERGWPRRWAAVARIDDAANEVDPEALATSGASSENDSIAGWRETQNGWTSLDLQHAFRLDGERLAGDQLHWLRYRHFVPMPEVWRTVLNDANKEAAAPERSMRKFGREPANAGRRPRPQLITDFCGYNAFSLGQEVDLDAYFWVGDLTLACHVLIEDVADRAELLLELNEGVHRYRCRIDPQTGEAQLFSVVWMNRQGDEQELLAKAPTAVTGPGEYRLTFANVDNRLCLWVNGKLIDFGAKAEYPLSDAENFGPQDNDLTPVAVAARGMSLHVSHLRIYRDVYYRSSHVQQSQEFTPWGQELEEWSPCSSHPHLRNLLSEPTAWYEAYKACCRDARFDLGPDEFLMLGDNSPRSKDSRLWGNDRRAQHRHAVPRSALVGKAFFVYWPHGQPFLNGGEGYPVLYHKEFRHVGEGLIEKTTDYPSDRAPFYPNLGRMHRIR